MWASADLDYACMISEKKSGPSFNNPDLPGGRLRLSVNKTDPFSRIATSKMSEITMYSIKTDLEKYNFG